MRYAHCRFCDDIRFEQGNKTSLIGLYGGELIISPAPRPGNPVVLPKLCIVAAMDTGASEPLSSLSISVSSNDTLVQEAALPAEELEALQEATRRTGSEADPIEVVSIGINLVVSPYIVEHEQTLKVTITADGVPYMAGKLRIKAPPVPAS